jgi:mannose-6-phosphate isomerase-like protein (cupin superfamily)
MYQEYTLLGTHNRRQPTTVKPDELMEAQILTVQDGIPVVYTEETIPVCAVRVVHPTNPKAPSVQHSVTMLYVPPRAQLELHSHETEETYCVISGTGLMLRNGGDREVGPGDFIFMPSWCDHGIVNTGKEMLTVLLCTSPPNA